MAGIEPAPPEWRSGTLPLSHIRKVGASPRIRTSRRADLPVSQDAGFTDRWQERDAIDERAAHARGCACQRRRDGVVAATAEMKNLSEVARRMAPPLNVSHCERSNPEA